MCGFTEETQSNPLFMDTLLIGTPHYYGQFALSQEKEKMLTFSLNSTRLIWTPP